MTHKQKRYNPIGQKCELDIRLLAQSEERSGDFIKGMNFAIEQINKWKRLKVTAQYVSEMLMKHVGRSDQPETLYMACIEGQAHFQHDVAECMAHAQKLMEFHDTQSATIYAISRNACANVERK